MEVENVEQSQLQSENRGDTGPRSAHMSESESKVNVPTAKMEDDDEEDEVVSHHSQQEVIQPSKSKFDQFKEEVKKREN